MEITIMGYIGCIYTYIYIYGHPPPPPRTTLYIYIQGLYWGNIRLMGDNGKDNGNNYNGL